MSLHVCRDEINESNHKKWVFFLNLRIFVLAVDNLIRENMVGIAEDKSNSHENICTRSYIDPVNFIVLLRKGMSYDVVHTYAK